MVRFDVRKRKRDIQSREGERQRGASVLICTPSGSRTGGVSAQKSWSSQTRLIERLEVARANPPAPAGKKRQSLVAVRRMLLSNCTRARFLCAFIKNRRLADGLDRFSKIESQEKNKNKTKQKKTETKGGCREKRRRPERFPKRVRRVRRGIGNLRSHRHHDLFFYFGRILLFFILVQILP